MINVLLGAGIYLLLSCSLGLALAKRIGRMNQDEGVVVHLDNYRNERRSN